MAQAEYEAEESRTKGVIEDRFEEEQEDYFKAVLSAQEEIETINNKRNDLLDSTNYMLSLQSKISESRVLLQTDKDCLHGQHVEIEALKVAQQKTRARLEQLLALAQPESQSRMHRTRSEPSPSAESLERWQEQRERLRKEISWFEKSYRDRVASILEDRAKRASSQREEAGAALGAARGRAGRLAAAVAARGRCAEDYLTLRRLAARAAVQQARSTAAMEREHQARLARRQKMKNDELSEVKNSHRNCQHHVHEVEHEMARQISQHENELKIIVEQHASLKKIYEQKIKALKSEHGVVRNKLSKLRQRFCLELEGFLNEAENISDQIDQLELWSWNIYQTSRVGTPEERNTNQSSGDDTAEMHPNEALKHCRVVLQNIRSDISKANKSSAKDFNIASKV